MNSAEFKYKLGRKVYNLYLNLICKCSFRRYCFFYASYRHSLTHRAVGTNENYIAARPNPGAGIGHQMANWMAGFYLSEALELRFANIPFSSYHDPWQPTIWNKLLGFGDGEVDYKDLLARGYKRVLLPLFNTQDEEQLAVIRRIVGSYADRRVVFVCEQDQFYRDLHTLIPELQRKFYTTVARKQDKLIYEQGHFNIAVHVRRGDIMTDSNNANLSMRYLANDYYVRVLSQVLEHVRHNSPIHIYLFSQGKPEDYPEFSNFVNLHWCMHMGAVDSFLHMVYADLLITSKSSFSYKPALLNRGIKVSPLNFWHGYPDSEDWIMADDEGEVQWAQSKI